MLAFLAQLPPRQPTGPQPHPPFDWAGGHLALDVAVIAAAVIIAVLLILWLLYLARRGRRAEELEAPSKELPPETPRVELPPSEAEQRLTEEAQSVRARVEELERSRAALKGQIRSEKNAEKKAELRAEAERLGIEAERLKRAEYQAKKAAERERKDRKVREREEVARLEAERARLEQEEAEAKERARQEAEQRRIAAQAGRTLASGLDRTKTQGFMAKLEGLFGKSAQVDEALLGELEEVLFTADIGVRTASKLVEVARDKLRNNALSTPEKIKAAIREEVERILALPIPSSLADGGPPHVTMVVGVNGSGKTTTIGKLAAKATADGKKVVLAAGDTFRAAAAEQLDVWAERAGAELVKGEDSADPASVVFDGIKRACTLGADLVIADTAGRLHTQAPLMEELKKVQRVMGKALPGAPHEVLLVLDATNGQNAIAQAKQFQEAVGVSAIALTKLDGTAKGGVVIGICDELKIPIVWAGVGEKVADLRRFDPKEFVSALFD